MKVTDGQVRREALAVHLAAPLRRRKSTFEHEPYGAAYIAVHRAHEMILVLDDQREAKEYSEAEEDRDMMPFTDGVQSALICQQWADPRLDCRV